MPYILPRLRVSATVATAVLAALAGCAEDQSPIVEPAVGDWSAVEREYVAEVRENAPSGRIDDDDAAIPWIAAGRAACARTSAGASTEDVLEAGSELVPGLDFTREDLISAAKTLCPANLDRAMEIALSREVF